MRLLPLRFIPENTKVNFLGKRWGAFILSITLAITSIVLLTTRGLNFGIDFTGGILIEVQFDTPPNLKETRALVDELKLGDVSLQTLDNDKTLLIRVGQKEGSEEEYGKVVQAVKSSLEAHYQGTVDYRKVDYVGPKVGQELIESGAIATLLAFAAILVYVWFRFEWQYGAGAVIALIHDTLLTLGFLSLTQLEFNLSSIAAILTIIGYSINDSVVIFDRIRENFRKYKKMPVMDLLNDSINHNLGRTIITSLTTAIALAALALVGGNIIESFSLAALFGVVVGTYSSIYIAAPTLIYMNLRK